MSKTQRDLFDACKRGDLAGVRQAVADGVDVRNAVDEIWLNHTPLHCASEYEHNNNK